MYLIAPLIADSQTPVLAQPSQALNHPAMASQAFFRLNTASCDARDDTLSVQRHMALRARFAAIR